MAKGNGADQSLAEVMALPNIDHRPSVFSDLKDLIVTDDEFGIVEQQLTLTVRFNRPDDQSWVRCRPGPEYEARVWGIKDKADRGRLYVVARPMLAVLGPHCRMYLVRQAVTTTQLSLMWPAPLSAGTREMPADIAHLTLQNKALDSWVRMWWDGGRNTWQGSIPEGDLGEPTWPRESFVELFQSAIADRTITDESHPLVRQLRGR
jgi:hypothetical protein